MRGATRTYCAFCLLCFTTSEAAAQSHDTQDVVIVAANSEFGEVGLPFDTVALDVEDLASAASLTEVLSKLSDVHAQAPGGRGGVTSVYLRGADPNFTQVLLEGVPLNDPNNSRGGSANVSDVSAYGVDRLEIVKGAASVVYGSGALAGAIYLGLPTGDTPMASWRVAVDTMAAWSVAGQWLGPLGDLKTGVSLVAEDDGRGVIGSHFNSRTLLAKIAADERSSTADAAFLRISDVDASAFPDASGGARYAVIRETASRHAADHLVGFRKQLAVNDVITVNVSGYALHRTERVTSPGVASSPFDPFGVPGGTDDTRFESHQLRAVVRYGPKADWRLAVGVAALWEKGESESELILFGMPAGGTASLQRETLSAFAEGDGRAGHWVFDVGVRVDSVDGYEAVLTGRAGASYHLPETDVVLRASAGTAFKLPSFYALSNPFVGNPDLNSEESRNLALGLRWQAASGAIIDIGLFGTRFGNLIDFDPGPPPRLRNVSHVFSRGASVSVEVPIDGLIAAGIHATYASTTNEETGEQLADRPELRVLSQLTINLGSGLSLEGRISYVGERHNFSVPTGTVVLPARTTAGASASLRLDGGARLDFVLDDIFDERAEDAIGFGSRGRALRVTLNSRL